MVLSISILVLISGGPLSPLVVFHIPVRVTSDSRPYFGEFSLLKIVRPTRNHSDSSYEKRLLVRSRSPKERWNVEIRAKVEYKSK